MMTFNGKLPCYDRLFKHHAYHCPQQHSKIGFVTSFVWTYPFGKRQLITSFLECVTTMRNHGIYYHPDLIKKLLNQIGES